MSSSYPPDGWVMASGAWGVDADQDDTLSYSGAYSVKLKKSGKAV
jgi:hypothetical protein